MPNRTRKWKKKEGSLLLTYTETLLTWWEEEQGEKIHFIQWVFGILKESVDEDLPRTNNAVEGFHSVLRSSITCKHPNIRKLIAGLKKEELQQNKIIHVSRGDAPPRKKIYKSIDRQLKTLVNTYDITATKFHFLITLQKYWLFSFY